MYLPMDLLDDDRSWKQKYSFFNFQKEH